MKNIAVAALLSAFVAAPAVAAGNADSFGVNFSVDNVFGIQGDFDISSMTNKAPVSVQVFLKNYSQNITPNVSWSTTGIGVAGIYDFNSISKLDKKIHPYAGLGLVYVTYSWTGMGPAWRYTGVSSGLYVTGGFKYTLTPQVAADLNYNNFGDLTAGINFGF